METNYQSQNIPGQRQEALPNATLILVLGIVSIFFCQPLGVAALIMGNSSLNLYAQNPGRYTESSLSAVNAGRICGIIAICLVLAFIVLCVVLLIAGISLFPFLQRYHD